MVLCIADTPTQLETQICAGGSNNTSLISTMYRYDDMMEDEDGGGTRYLQGLPNVDKLKRNQKDDFDKSSYEYSLEVGGIQVNLC